MNTASRRANIENMQAIDNRCLCLCNEIFTVTPDKNILSESFAKSVSAIFKKVEVQLIVVVSLVVNYESLVRMPRTSDSDIRDTRTILRPILRLTYDFHGFIRVTRTSLSDMCHHLYS